MAMQARDDWYSDAPRTIPKTLTPKSNPTTVSTARGVVLIHPNGGLVGVHQPAPPENRRHVLIRHGPQQR
jgi:hypothetical protein